MDVFNKLKNSVSNTLSNTVSNTAHSLSQLSNVLPGNPVTREYEVASQIGSAGPGLLWKVYNGFKKSTKQKVAIFVFEKRLLDQTLDKNVKDNIVEILKKGVIQLTKLRHPQILTVQHPLEESRDSLAFATEPVFCSLANILGIVDNLPQTSQVHLTNYKILDLEIKFGLYQLGESLAFLHNDVKMLHRNLAPESILVNDHGDWKIFGFDFCSLNQSDDKPNWSCIDFALMPNIIRPLVVFQSPESIKLATIGPSSDIFSLGALICFIHSSTNLIWSNYKYTSNYEFYLEELKKLALSKLDLPKSLQNAIKLIFHNDPNLRPDAYEFLKIEYFNDIDVKTLIYLDKLFQWDNLQKSKFYKELPQILKHFPWRVTLQKVLPALQKEFVNAPMIPFLLPSILLVMEDCTLEEFNNSILPMLKQIFVIEEPLQISLMLLQRIELLLKWCSSDIVKNYMIPLMTRALDSQSEHLQQQCLTSIPFIVSIVDGPCLKNSIVPRMRKICLSGRKGNFSLSVQVNCLLCLSKILGQLDAWLVRDEILPFIQQIPCHGEPALLMPVIGICRLILSNSKLNIGKDILATKVLPFLLPLSVDQSFMPQQYELLVTLINDIIDKVTVEHREALSQLQKTRQFQEDMVNYLTTSSMISQDTSIDKSASIQTKNEFTSTPSLSLDDKYRLLKEEELSKCLKNQKPLIPQAVTPFVPKQTPKDLTDTLLASNLHDLDWSASNKTSSNFVTANSSLTSKIPLNTRPNSISNSFASNATSPTWNQPQNFVNNKWSNISNGSMSNATSGWNPQSPLSSKNHEKTLFPQNQASLKLSAEDIINFLK